MRIAIAGISHESLNFSPVSVSLEEFRVWRGEELLQADSQFAPYESGVSGKGKYSPSYATLAEMMQDLGVEAAPILHANALAPSGVVQERAYLQLRDEIVAGIRQAGHLDGVCLILHGALLVENIWSGETDLVRSIRAVVGQDVPIAARLDLHGNLTEEFANKTDIWTVYRTAPHRDAAQTLERAMTLLVRSIREGLRPRPAFVRVPLLLPGEISTTDVEPMKSLLARVGEIERQAGILTAEILVGFAWADAAHASSSVAVIAEDEAHLPHARHEVKRLAQAMWDERHNFTFDQEVAASADEAIDLALAAEEGTVFIADSGDNPTAGTPGDVTHFLARLLAKQTPDAIFAGIPDGTAARACFEQGVGATVSLRLGGKLDSEHGGPLDVTGVVEHLYRPEGDGKEAAIATLGVDGVRVLISDRRNYYSALDDFRRAGVEPLEHKIVVVKLGYLMPELRDAAPREILALTPGYSDMDLTRLPYRQVTRPVFPLDKGFEWRPMISNVAGYDG
ncbi:MAG: M81 family metallopeptidase [Caldilineaceae bacterium]|nr:M81 family metallopeptidase [Caldilineaceae bacterium]